jgi:hypothetical protein
MSFASPLSKKDISSLIDEFCEGLFQQAAILYDVEASSEAERKAQSSSVFNFISYLNTRRKGHIAQ